jgi:hypothetical protein
LIRSIQNIKLFLPILVTIAVLVALASSLGRFLVSGALVLLAPGYLLWQVLGGDLRLPRLAAPALWIALSLSITPLVFLWSSTLGLRLSPTVLRVVFISLGLAAVWLWAIEHRAPSTKRQLHRSNVPPFQRSTIPTPNPQPPTPIWLWASFGLLFGLVALTRVLHIRGIAMPLWVDSVHHTLLVRVVGETGRIPVSLQPYLPIDELPYHWGYHTVVAAWRGLTDVSLVPAVLWSGQVLNALVMPSMYAFGAYILRSPRGGLLAAGCAGLLSILPAYYVTWGRYTQLTGLLVLPVLLITSMALLERQALSWRTLIPTATLLAGLFLIHYRVLIFYAAFMLPYALLLLARRPRHAAAMVIRCLLLGGIMLLLVAPWAALLVRRMLVPLASMPSGFVGTDSYNNVDRALLLAGNSRALFVVASIGALLAVLQRRWRVLALVGWIATMLLIANPTLAGLPPLWLINNHAVIITLFVPVSVLAAHGANSVWLRIERMKNEKWNIGMRHDPSSRHLPSFIFNFLMLGFALWGTWNLRSVVHPQTILAADADLRAIEWVAEHTPADARFLTNSTPWLNDAPRGTDAGWWLLPLAGRWVSTPPALYVYGSPEYKQAMDDLNRRVAALATGDRAALHDLVRRERIDYLYLGARGGPIKPELVRNDPMFVPVYDQAGVLIVAVQLVP